jgi:hypothetical protein
MYGFVGVLYGLSVWSIRRQARDRRETREDSMPRSIALARRTPETPPGQRQAS